MNSTAGPTHSIKLSDLIITGKFFLLALLLFSTAITIGLIHLLSPVNPNSTAVVHFEVLKGWGALDTSKHLEDQGLIRNGTLFSLMLRVKNLDTRIGEGLYELNQGMSAHQTSVRLIAGGQPRTTKVLLPEGLRDNQVAQTLAVSGFGSETGFRSLISKPGLLRLTYIPEDLSLEGFLFPASYEIPTESTPEEVLTILLNRFDQEITPDIITLLSQRNLSIIEWVILASLVQAEAGGDDEMTIIAGVFLNRLDQGIPLQSDPTVAYGLGKPLTELDITSGDFDQDHEWNTYMRSGLPLGPISNPGQMALHSVLSPQRVNPDGASYLYFLHGFDGDERVFRPNVSLADHNRDRNRFIKR